MIKIILKKIVIMSLVLTIPFSILFFTWTYNTLNMYFKLDQVNVLSLHRGSRLFDIGVLEYVSLKRSIESYLGNGVESKVNIYIKNNYIKELDSDLLHIKSKDKKAVMMIDNKAISGKVKYRGDNYYHWMFPQKSWRFKTSKNNLYNGIRKLNFIIPKGHELINNQLSYKLAKQLELLAPSSELTTLSVNNKFNGVKLMVEQIDESFLRANRRMPNDIYKGDNMGSKMIIGATINIFDTPSIWEKVSYNNHYDKSNLKPLTTFLMNQHSNNFDMYDMLSFAKFAAFIDITNTYHYDKVHNWILYYDAYYEKMYPIIWDPLGWWEDWDNRHRINLITSDLLHTLYGNYKFISMKYDTMYKFYKQENDFIELLDAEISKAEDKINEVGYTMRIAKRKLYDKEKSITNLEIFREKVLKRHKLLKEYFVGSVNSKDYKYSFIGNNIRLSIAGTKLIKKVIIKYKNISKINSVNIKYYANGMILKKDISEKVKKATNEIIIEQNLLPKAILLDHLKFEEATYDFIIDGLNNNDIESISLKFLNLNNESLTLKKAKNIEQKYFGNLHDIIVSSPYKMNLTWDAIKHIQGSLVIDNNIIIKPGTKIILDENSTLKVLGKVTAIGTKEKPIVFEAKDKTKPWNAFALKDRKADGSIFKHCIFQDGSGDKGDLYEYTAMFSVHNVKDILVEDCEFYDSHRTDDMVHVIYSDATFKNTKFVRSLSDALDVDISNVIVDGCEFIDSGNDSIDLMTTNAIVTNTKFTNSADKGISIGEGSNLLAVNNYIEGNEIGMQSKDTSKAYIYNTSFVGNKKAVDAYHKNWRYSEGGTIILDNCVFEENIINATVGKKSIVVINNSDIDSSSEFDSKSIRKKKIILSNDDFIEYDFKEALFQDKSNLINESKRGYYE